MEKGEVLPDYAPSRGLEAYKTGVAYQRGVALINYFWVKMGIINLELFWIALTYYLINP